MQATRQREHRFTAKSARLYTKIKALQEKDIPKGKIKEYSDNIVKWFDDNAFLTGAQWRLCDVVIEFCHNYEEDKKLMDSLEAKLEEGSLPEKSERFVSSVLDWFDEKHFITENQREQAMGIDLGNPKDTTPRD